MKTVFADSSYWIALMDRSDRLHKRATQFSAETSSDLIFTSEMVLVEVINYFSGRPSVRRAAVETVEDIRGDERCRVVPQTSDQFTRALRLFRRRDDKQWSLTDCASFLIMQTEGITEALTYDNHFAQAGFTPLLRPTS